MRKLYKQMSIEGIKIELDNDCQAKELSRVKFSVFEDGDINRVYTTKSYADIKDNKIEWSQFLQLRYIGTAICDQGQARLTFQTFCQHQFGYQKQQLKVLYKGVYFLKNEMFFRRDSTHVYNLEGEKKGLLKWQIKVVTREQQEQTEQELKEKERPLVREDLIGSIKMHQATLQITNPVMNMKKYQEKLVLKIKFDEKVQFFKNHSPLKWKLDNLKLEYVVNGSKTIEFQLYDQNKLILQGKTDCKRVQQLRRYIHHNVPLLNKNGIKVGKLVLEYRYIAKKQLLDLIYSPNNKLNYTSQGCESSNKFFKASSSQGQLIKQKQDQSSTSIYDLSYSKIKAESRYKVSYLMNQNSDIKIPRATRFSSSKTTNPNISYLDPQKISDFVVKNEKGSYITKSSKFDFTRQLKGNPGVGSYKLPSIWSKY